MAEPLTSCGTCARYVRVLEDRCPFCGAAQGWRLMVRLRGVVAVIAVGVAAACGGEAEAPAAQPAVQMVPMAPAAAPVVPAAPPPTATPAVVMSPLPPQPPRPVAEPEPAVRRVRRARLKRVPDPILIAPPYGAPPIDGPRLI